MQIKSASKQRVPRHVYTRKSNKERRQNVIPLIKRTMTRGLCRHRTARAKGPKRLILVCPLTLSQKCERDVKNTEPVVIVFCRRAASVARARGKRVSLKKRRTRSKTRNYLFKGFYPFCTVFRQITGRWISLIVLKDWTETFFSVCMLVFTRDQRRSRIYIAGSFSRPLHRLRAEERD